MKRLIEYRLLHFHSQTHLHILDPDNYLWITVTSLKGKLILVRTKTVGKEHHSSLQSGFTQVVSPTTAAMLITKAICQSQNLNEALHTTFLDARKAFRIVCHSGVLNIWPNNVSRRVSGRHVFQHHRKSEMEQPAVTRVTGQAGPKTRWCHLPRSFQPSQRPGLKGDRNDPEMHQDWNRVCQCGYGRR